MVVKEQATVDPAEDAEDEDDGDDDASSVSSDDSDDREHPSASALSNESMFMKPIDIINNENGVRRKSLPERAETWWWLSDTSREKRFNYAFVKKLDRYERMYHAIHGYDFVMPKARRRTLNQGANNTGPPPNPLRDAATIEDLEALYQATDWENGENTARFAASTISFHCMLKHRDVADGRVKNFDPGNDLSIDDMEHHDAAGSIPEHWTGIIPYDKSEHRQGQKFAVWPSNTKYCPVRALNIHVKVNNPPSRMGLVSYRTDKDKNVYQQLTKSHFVKANNVVFIKAKRKRVPGRAWRIGGCCYFMLMKKDTTSCGMEMFFFLRTILEGHESSNCVRSTLRNLVHVQEQRRT